MVNELIAFQPAILSKYWYRVENVPLSINSSKLSFSPNQSPFFRTIISCWKMWASILHNIFGSSESQINFSWCNDGNSRFRALLLITVNSNIWAYFRRATTNQRRTYIYIYRKCASSGISNLSRCIILTMEFFRILMVYLYFFTLLPLHAHAHAHVHAHCSNTVYSIRSHHLR